MDFEKFDLELLGSDAASWKIQRVEDHSPVLIRNHHDRVFGNNGWKQGHGARQIARIPAQVIDIAENMGYNLKTTEGIYTFLHDYPKYKSVPYIKSPDKGSAVSQGRIIIK
ncbi:MAG: hypothetical protein DRP02_12725 [Candidatus Gerdarchaeota archaeon]|nr:MAG: hypothetical protein DRP02_12725 [Candidatus Gerdarchaeota archaeon]